VTGIYPKCVEIPFDTEFNSSECAEIEGYSLFEINSETGFEKGKYSINYLERAIENSSAICFYIKD
jgi:hypothetical protein